MKKVLIAFRHFEPTEALGMQRFRLAQAYWHVGSWEPVILAVHPDSVNESLYSLPVEAK